MLYKLLRVLDKRVTLLHDSCSYKQELLRTCLPGLRWITSYKEGGEGPPTGIVSL